LIELLTDHHQIGIYDADLPAQQPLQILPLKNILYGKLRFGQWDKSVRGESENCHAKAPSYLPE
jgi:hypothetical protein